DWEQVQPLSRRQHGLRISALWSVEGRSKGDDCGGNGGGGNGSGDAALNQIPAAL
ncbi:hypothetical protein Tco_1558958, partial [Tanacetum coccineum]